MFATGGIFDLRGPEFLRLYLLLFLGALFAALLLRWLMRSPGEPTAPLSSRSSALGPYELAYLAGGARATAAAAVATLVHRGLVRAKLGKLEAEADALNLRDGDLLERAAFASIRSRSNATLAKVREAIEPLLPGNRLESLGLIVSPLRANTIRAMSAMPLIALISMGLMKAMIGINRHRPVGFLVVLLIVSAVIAIAFLAKPILRSRAGDAVLRATRTNNASLRSTAASRPGGLNPGDLALACALFGPAVFVSADEEVYRNFARNYAPANSSTSWSSGCGSSCGGGSGCGGGGCGGGGCGGCGS